MNNDVHVPLGALYKTGAQLRDDMVELQNRISTTRDESMQWANSLRFLCIESTSFQPPQATFQPHELVRSSTMASNASSSSFVSRTSEGSLYPEDEIIILRLSDRGEFDGVTDYIAVSYCWAETAKPPHPHQPGKILIQTAQGLRLPHAPHSVLYRTYMYARKHNIRLIWIDQECILQSDPSDKSMGINAMDIVYSKSKHPLGIATATIASQKELDFYAAAFRDQWMPNDRKTVLDHTCNIIRKYGIDATMQLTSGLCSDKLWTRTWIFEEFSLTKNTMTLLVYHARGLEKPPELSSLALEIEVNTSALRSLPMALLVVANEDQSQVKASTKALLDIIRRTFGIRQDYAQRDVDEIWHRMERRTISNLLPQMQTRTNHIVSDRIAIVANLLSYLHRLHLNAFDERRYGLTACLFTLGLVNGDIDPFNDLHHSQSSKNSAGFWYDQSRDGLMKRSFLNFLIQWDNLNPCWNNPTGGRPRFPFVRIRHDGLQLRGWFLNVKRKFPLSGWKYKHNQLLTKLDQLAGGESPLVLKHAIQDFFWQLLVHLYRFGHRALGRACLRSLGLISNTKASRVDHAWAGDDRIGLLINTNNSPPSVKMSEHDVFKAISQMPEGTMQLPGFSFPILEDFDRRAPWIVDFVRGALQQEGIWVGCLNGQPRALFGARKGCSIFLTTQANVKHLGLGAPLGILNVHCLEVEQQPSSWKSRSPPRLFYSGRRMHGMWDAEIREMRDYVFPWSSSE